MANIIHWMVLELGKNGSFENSVISSVKQKLFSLYVEPYIRLPPSGLPWWDNCSSHNELIIADHRQFPLITRPRKRSIHV